MQRSDTSTSQIFLDLSNSLKIYQIYSIYMILANDNFSIMGISLYNEKRNQMEYRMLRVKII